MIKIKSKNVDIAKLIKIQDEFQTTESELSKLSCDGTSDEGIKKYNNEHNSILNKLQEIKLKFMKEFYKAFDGRCIRVSGQGQSTCFFDIKDVKIKKVKDERNIVNCRNITCKGDTFAVNVGNSRCVCKSFLTEANKQGSMVINHFALEKFWGPATTITEITKKEFEEQYKSAVPKDITRDVEVKLTPWNMKAPRAECEELEDMKRLHVELTLANTSVLLAKERIKNLCLYQNMAKDVAECKDKKLKTCMHKMFLAEIEKSDKKIETFEGRIEKNKESLEKKLYLVKKAKKKS